MVVPGSLAMIRGADDIGEKGKAPAKLSLTNGASSLSSTVYKILKQAGKPLGPKEIVLLGPTNGRTINYQSLTGLMAGKIKQGKQFYREGSGKNSKYGLLELKSE